MSAGKEDNAYIFLLPLHRYFLASVLF